VICLFNRFCLTEKHQKTTKGMKEENKRHRFSFKREDKYR